MAENPLPLGQILAGDCREVLATFPDHCIDLVFADPPYNLSGHGLRWQGKSMGGDWYMVNEQWDTMNQGQYQTFTRDWLKEVKRVLKPTGAIYVCGTLHNLGTLLSTLEQLELRALNVITWYKPNAMPSMTRRTYTHACEYLLYFARGTNWTFNYEEVKRINPERRKDGETKQMRDLWTFPVCQGHERLHREDGRALHPTQKPEALVERAIAASSHPEDVILDPFMGSGTTAVVAQRLGRRWIGIERDPGYRDAALARLHSARVKG